MSMLCGHHFFSEGFMNSKKSRGIAVVSALLLGAVFSVAAIAQAPPAGGPPPGGAAGGAPAAGGMGAGPSPAEQAIKYRQALYTVLGGNFGGIGGMLQGRAPFNGDNAAKGAMRAAQVAAMLVDAYPDISKEGNTKAKAEIWTNRAEFDKLNKDLADHTAALAAVLAKDKTESAAFKSAATAVANDCKTCHDKFRAK
jgi:cytochrome c556